MATPINTDRFELLLSENMGIIYKICNSYCKDPEDRKDLAQEIIIHLWKSFHTYDAQYKLSTWMYRIALNVAISFYRSSKKGLQIVYPGIEIDQVDDAGEQERKECEIQQLYTFMEGLNKLDKALMILYLEENSYKEMSHILGISETNVATKLNRIRQKLKIQFEII